MKARLGKQRGTKVAQVDLARRLAEAIWHMLTRNQPFAPAGATDLERGRRFESARGLNPCKLALLRTA